MTRMWMRLHPMTQWLYYAVSLLLGMFLFHPILFIVGIFVLTVVHVFFFKSFRLARWYGMAFFLLCLFIIMNSLLLQREGHVLFVFIHPITFEAMIYGFTLGLSIAMMLLVFRLYRDLFPSALFLTLFSRFFPQWSLLFVLSLRFVSILQRKIESVLLGQTFRYDGSTKLLRRKLKHVGDAFAAFIGHSLEDALQTMDSMKARSYGVRKRSHYHSNRWTSYDVIICVWFALLFFSEVYLWFRGYGVLQLYPKATTVFLHGLDWLSIAILCLVFGTPLMYEGGERFRWFIWRQRT